MSQLAIRQLLDLALRHHQDGRLQEAEQLYQQILAREPGNASVLHLLGILAGQAGRPEAAIELIRRAIQITPGDAALHNNLGESYRRAGRPQEAIIAYRQALALHPNWAEVHYNLGATLQSEGQRDQAIAAFRQALALNPNLAEAHYNLGNALQAAGQVDQAIAAFRQVLALNPNWAQAHYNLGNALQAGGQLDQAIAAFRQALALNPNVAEVHNNLGTALHASGQTAPAMAALRQALALNPNFAKAHNNLGSALQTAGQMDEAIAAFRRALDLNPNFAKAHNNLGAALQIAGQLQQAIAAYRQAVILDPGFAQALTNLGNALCLNGQLDDAMAAYQRLLELNLNLADTHNNLGAVLQAKGQVDQAIAAYRRGVALNPDSAEMHSNLGFALLLRGEFAEGWEEREWRWKSKDFSSAQRHFPQGQWEGQPLEGRTLLLHAEQGVGDTLQLVRYLPLVTRLGGQVILECQAQLQRLLQPIAGACRLVPQGHPLPEFDVHCPLLSLPRLFHTTPENIPREVPYLHADAIDVDIWRQRLAKAGDRGQGTGDRAEDAPGAPTGSCIGSLAVPCPLSPVPCLKVGLAWAGNPIHKNDRNRSLALARLAPLAQVPGIRFVSLQTGEAAAQVRSAPPGLELLGLSAELNDFADTAAVLANLDLVIAVDTAVAHLAGAMGRPVWVLLPFGPDWRWLLEREDTPWYPTMRLFRQPAIGDWDSVVARVVEALAAR